MLVEGHHNKEIITRTGYHINQRTHPLIQRVHPIIQRTQILARAFDNRIKAKKAGPGISEIGLKTLKSLILLGFLAKEKYSDSIIICTSQQKLDTNK